MKTKNKKRYRQIIELNRTNYEYFTEEYQEKLSRYIEKKLKLRTKKNKIIDLMYMDLEGYELAIDHLKIKKLYAEHIKAKEKIYNEHQEADEIHNSSQIGTKIFNDRQCATKVYNYNQKGKEKIDNEKQETLKKLT